MRQYMQNTLKTCGGLALWQTDYCGVKVQRRTNLVPSPKIKPMSKAGAAEKVASKKAAAPGACSRSKTATVLSLSLMLSPGKFQ